jgi:hypothetical protein
MCGAHSRNSIARGWSGGTIDVNAETLRPRSDLTLVELDGEAVIFDETTCELHHLNASATIVWSLMEGTQTARDVASAIAETMNLRREEIEPQVIAVVDTFRSAGLLAVAEGSG